MEKVHSIDHADRTHRAVSADGTEIAGRVVGHGPPLVLVHAGLGDGTLDWGPAASFLGERFTCYLPGTRGRGSSADHPDQSSERLVEDVTAFVESVGEPVGVAGTSGGSLEALGAAARSEAVTAVAACDPLAFEVLGEEDEARLRAAIDRLTTSAEQGRLVEAARDWLTEWANDHELAALSDSGYLEACAKYVPVLVRMLEQIGDADGFSPTDPSVLDQIEVPTSILVGSHAEATWPWFTECVRHIAEHVADAHVRQVPGVGHMAAWVEPGLVAEELGRFFDTKLERT
jgi:pimeloyl-ACP methyl ester carboxylesterase